tara:strand:+ start:22519 stop:23904 length:1386 start_codon:yes stop_codon:yes gene_type:complete
MSQNIPVRFVRADGETIQLPVTTLTLDVDRGVNATPLPFTGSARMAVDFNLSRAVILLEGVFTDDDLMNIGSDSPATALIDFTRLDRNAMRFDNEDVIKDIFDLDMFNDVIKLDTLIQIKNTTGQLFNIYASRNDTSHGFTSFPSGDRHHFSVATIDGVQTTSTLVAGSGYSVGNDIAISGTTGSGVNCKVNITGVNGSGGITSFEIAHPGSGHAVGDVLTITGGSATFTVASVGVALTAEQMATNFVKLISDTGLSTPITGFSATLTTSPNTGEANSAVTITQTVAGKDGNTNTPNLNNFNKGSFQPFHTEFKGGKSQGGLFTGMSAGDKVMTLYATLNNSNNPTILQDITDGVRGIVGFNKKYGDYIIGVQIPFNSSINATDGNKYKPVNFFMPTGAFETLESKSVTDAVAASTKPESPDSNNDRSFIKGAVTKATFVQVGGEPVYTFNIQFIPASFII